MIIIGLHGVAGAGKSTAARILEDDFGFHVVPFAGPLKRMAAEYGLTKHDMSEGKEQPFGRALPDLDHRRAQKMLIAMGIPLVDLCLTPDKPLPYLGGKTARAARESLVEWGRLYRGQMTTPRRFLQLIGTEWGRGMVCPSLWIHLWDMDCQVAIQEDGAECIVADDCRFPNEATHIRSKTGRVIEIKREGAGTASGSGHASEAGIPAHLIDISLWNDGDEAVLRARMRGTLDRFCSSEAI